MDFFPGEPGTKEIQANPVPRTSTERREMLDPPEPAKSISLSKCPVFPTSVMSFNFPHVDQSDDTCWGNKDVDLRHEHVCDFRQKKKQPHEHACTGKQRHDHQNQCSERKRRSSPYPQLTRRFPTRPRYSSCASCTVLSLTAMGAHLGCRDSDVSPSPDTAYVVSDAVRRDRVCDAIRPYGSKLHSR